MLNILGHLLTSYWGNCLVVVLNILLQMCMYLFTACSSVISLGVENAGSLPSQNFQASSHSSLYPPSQGRLNSYSAWCEALSGSANQYLQIDLGAVKHLCAVETQGSGIFGDWVTTYSIHYSKDGVTWNQIQTNGIEKVDYSFCDYIYLFQKVVEDISP